ncbi:hypothetical protein [Thermus albus]|uniref:hypothetical protein n=1 Tax=Thermus albus TaxID=2908146 RepID=UPI001FAACEEF|nr:hypothetical protein [Thermus albus]
MREVLRKHFPDLVSLASLLGFLTILAELLLTGHTEGIQLIASLSALVGAGLLGLGLLLNRGRSLVILALFLLSATGLLGLVQHLEEGLDKASTPILQGPLWADREGGYFYEEEGKKEAAPPPLAPLSLSGLALLGALALYVGERDEGLGGGG